MRFESTLAYAQQRDASDPLRDFRERFALPRDAHGSPLTYLCGQSLGPLPLAARTLVTEELDDWAHLAVRGHESARRPWLDYHEHLSAGLEQLTGGHPGEVVAMNSLTINLHLMLASFYRPAGQRTRILIEAGAFPSDRHAVVSQIAWHGLDPHTELIELAPTRGELIDEAALEGAIEEQGPRLALVLWPGVQYRTGQSFDVARVTAAAHRAGSAAGFDLAHSIGNVPLALHATDADFAVWCSYKYLNGGPGAIAGCFVHERHAVERTRPRLAGWWGHEPVTRFAMRPEFRASPGARGWQVSNPPILSSAPLIASLEIFRAAGIERLRAKSIALTGFLEHLLAPLPVTIVTPRAAEARGCQLSLRLNDAQLSAREIHGRLEAAGAICDWREPDVLRVAPAPLYNRFTDVFRFVEVLTESLAAPGRRSATGATERS
ncbi:MAG TPA: kynureninase [Steroidobacteraceae bacterium]|nr:kynureninase [Steroidobacteraceae bacterium]